MSDDLNFETIKKQFSSNKMLKTVTIVIVAIAVLVVGYIAYRQLVWAPKNEKSKDMYVKGLNFAAQDSTDAAIKELTIIAKKYDGKIGGEIASFSLARQLMSKGQYAKALDYLNDTDLKDTYTSVMVIGLKGDCYSEMGKFQDALDTYEKAAEKNANDFTSPTYLMKAAQVAELRLKNYAKAEELYIKIRDDYRMFGSQKQIEKYIARVATMIKK